MSTNLENSQWSQDWKTSVFIPIPKKDNAKECSSSCTIVLISHASKVILKILQARVQQYVNWELSDIQAGFRKGRGIRDKIANIQWVTEENSRKTSTSASLTTLNPLTVWITKNCGKFFISWEYQTTLPASWETCMQVKKQQIEPDREQKTGSKLGKEYLKAEYCHLAYLAFYAEYTMQNASWINHKLESKLLGEISTTSDMQMIPP